MSHLCDNGTVSVISGTHVHRACVLLVLYWTHRMLHGVR